MSRWRAVTESGLPLVYINQVGGQDELVFDGASFALNADRSIAFHLPAFRETVVTTQWSRTGGTWRCTQGPLAPAKDAEQADYTACVLGLRDYVDKNRFKASCSACPAASIRHCCARRWRRMRSAPIGCAA